MIPACAAGGADEAEWGTGGSPGTGNNASSSGNSSSGNGSSSGNSSSGNGSSSGNSSSGNGSSSGHTSTSSSSSGNTSTSSSSSGNTSTSSSSSSSSSTTSTGGTTCTTSSNSMHLAFSAYPALMNANGTASFSGSGYSDPACGQPNIIVLAKGGGSFIAFSSSCPHNCCIVKLSGSSFHCGCHGANFSTTTGACTNGVTGTPLSLLQVCADSTGVTVTW